METAAKIQRRWKFNEGDLALQWKLFTIIHICATAVDDKLHQKPKNSFFMTQSRKVISLYRQILRLSKNWKALKPEETLKERAAIREEAREAFRTNAKETDASKIDELIRETESRIAQAEHYRIPFKRPEYLPPSSSYDVNVKKGIFRKRERKTLFK